MAPRGIGGVLVAVAGVFIASSAGAVVPRPIGPRIVADTLTALPAAGAKPLRTHVELAPGVRATPAWRAFTTATHLTSWEVMFDVATGVPSRIWGAGIVVPGASTSPQIAELVAHQLLVDHLGLLAPGAHANDFVFVADHWDGDIRSIGFAQRWNGMRVLGGQVSFRFKRDRLFVIGSEALPNVAVSTPRKRALDRAVLAQRATATLRTMFALPLAAVRAPEADLIVPFVGDAAVLGYRIATPITIDGGNEGRYVAYVDPATGEPLATRQLNAYASGTVRYRDVDRYPARGRIDRSAPRAHIALDGVSTTTTLGGIASWAGTNPQTATLGVGGDLVTVIDKTATDAASATIDVALADGGSVLWDASADPSQDAQLITYLSINRVKEFVRANIDPALPMLDTAIVANTNIAQDCNAFFDGEAVNFFHASATCENTGRIEDVIFHEFGHDVHVNEVIPGVGAFDGAMSEGAADFLAVSITGDSGMGRGFTYTDAPLRELDPPDKEWTYPQDVGEIHATGRIYGGTFWDLRTALIAKYGEAPGIALTLKLYVGTLRRATSIPTTLIEALASDDDDGDLSNGTPNECEIRAAWGRHGMRTVTGQIEAPGTLDLNALQTQVTIGLIGQSTRCHGDAIAGVTFHWYPSYTNQPMAGNAEATPTADGGFFAALSLALQEAVFYFASIHFADGTELTLADNPADPAYQLYQGSVVKLYCTNFDTDPFLEGWTTTTGDGAASPWVWDVVPGTGATDPPAAFSGSHALVQALGGDYLPTAFSQVSLPPIDVGMYSDVRLQYRRWLAVEDSHYDQARITVNGQKAWQNSTQNTGDNSARHHIDKEWRFHDVPLSGWFHGHRLQIAFDLTADPGLELGGWAIDDLCVVANRHAICGDGIRTPTESCDLGHANANVADTCRTDCQLPKCGDAIIDSNEECDDGPDGSLTCTNKCQNIPNDNPSCSVGSSSSLGALGSPFGGGMFALLVSLGLAALRRYRAPRSAPKCTQPTDSPPAVDVILGEEPSKITRLAR